MHIQYDLVLLIYFILGQFVIIVICMYANRIFILQRYENISDIISENVFEIRYTLMCILHLIGLKNKLYCYCSFLHRQLIKLLLKI